MILIEKIDTTNKKQVDRFIKVYIGSLQGLSAMGATFLFRYSIDAKS